jgi:SPP1 gp7 family putative phage head morphogenesis protein
MAAIVRGDRDAERAAESRLADLIANSQALADAYGRRRIMLETAAIRKREPSPGLQLDLRSSAGPIDPGDTFGGALDAVLARDPVLARTRSEIRTAYSREHGFALIRSSKIEITKAVQRAVTKAIVAGESVDDAAKMIEKLGPFSRAYAETVYRTNVTTAYTAGRFRQARDPVVADVVKAMRYEAINDSVTRPAHAKLDGLIAAVDDPIWQKIAPPNGYNCRCTVELVSGADLKRKRLIGARGAVLAAKIPSDWNADPGFKNVGRPDLLIYG